MNPTLRRVIIAGLGSLAMTEKAVRQLIDDLVSKGDITRSEGERILVDLEQKWMQESGRFGERWEKGRKRLERLISGAVSGALDRFGLVRKSEVGAAKQRSGRSEAKRRQPASAGRARRVKKAAPSAKGSSS